MTPRNYRLLRQLRDLEKLDDMPTRVAIAQKIAEKARGLVPVDTGRLRDSIQEKDGNVRSDVPYAYFVEFGTVNMEAQPFLRPAVDIYYREIVEAAAQAMNQQIAEKIK
jgi:HK97 gp10 family phage protein